MGVVKWWGVGVRGLSLSQWLIAQFLIQQGGFCRKDDLKMHFCGFVQANTNIMGIERSLEVSRSLKRLADCVRRMELSGLLFCALGPGVSAPTGWMTKARLDHVYLLEEGWLRANVDDVREVGHDDYLCTLLPDTPAVISIYKRVGFEAHPDVEFFDRDRDPEG